MENGKFKYILKNETLGNTKAIGPIQIKVESDFQFMNQLQRLPICKQEHFEGNEKCKYNMFQKETLGNIKETLNPTKINVETDFQYLNQLKPLHVCKHEQLEEYVIKTEHFSSSLSGVICEELKIENSDLMKIKDQYNDTDKYILDNIVKSELLSKEYDIPFKSEDEGSVCEEQVHRSKHKCTRKVRKKYNLKSKGFSSSSSRIIHAVYHSSNKFKICSFCGQVSIAKLQFVHHLVKYHLVIRRRMSVLRNFVSLQPHKRQINLALSPKVKRVFKHLENIKKSFKCQICVKRFKQKYTLQKRIHRSEKSHNSEISLKSLKHEYLRKHLHSHSNKSIEKVLSSHDKALIERLISCVTCNKTFKHRSSLRRHMRTHTAQNFTCDICSKAVRSRSDLEIHIRRIHMREKLFKCEICSKYFIREISLTEHLQTHSNSPIQELLNCVTCDKKFRKKRNLARHVRLHCNSNWVNEKPFKCDICLKSFALKRYLSRHKKRHTSNTKRFISTAAAYVKCNSCFAYFRGTSCACKNNIISYTNVVLSV